MNTENLKLAEELVPGKEYWIEKTGNHCHHACWLNYVPTFPISARFVGYVDHGHNNMRCVFYSKENGLYLQYRDKNDYAYELPEESEWPEKFGEKWVPKEGEKIHVCEDDYVWHTRKFFAMDGNKFVCYSDLNDENYDAWTYAERYK